MSTNLIVQDSCHSFLNSSRITNLNYGIQETPHSIFISIRKSLDKSFVAPQNLSTKITSVPVEEFSRLVSHCKFLEDSNGALKTDFEDEVAENEVNLKKISELEDKVIHLCDEIKDADQ